MEKDYKIRIQHNLRDYLVNIEIKDKALNI